MNTFLGYIILGNPVKTWLWTVAIVAVTFIVIRLFKALILKRLQAMAERPAGSSVMP